MMGWAFVIGFAAVAWIAFWRSGRCPRAALEVIGAALLLAIAGYGWLGSPDMPGKPVVPAGR
jgi:cytochrome c-type biogenesis protein CcmH